MTGNIFAPDKVQDVLLIIKEDLLFSVWETVYVTLLSTLFAIIIGLPLGILLVVGEKGSIMPLPKFVLKILDVVINFLRSVPFIILMILVFPLTRLVTGTVVGTKATVVPLVVAAFPFIARLVEGSMREVDGNLIEMAQAMGASPLQIIVKVMIPEALPSLITNFTIAITTILGYSCMSGILGGGGLGKIALNYGYYRWNTLAMIVAVIVIVILVQVFQTVGTFIAKKTDKRLR